MLCQMLYQGQEMRGQPEHQPSWHLWLVGERQMMSKQTASEKTSGNNQCCDDVINVTDGMQGAVERGYLGAVVFRKAPLKR